MTLTLQATDVRTDLTLDELWERHGAAMSSLACAMTGDSATGTRTAWLVIREIAPTGDGGEDLGRIAEVVYRRALDIAPGGTARTASAPLPEVMVRLSRMAHHQRASLALCVYGGLTYRRVAEVLDIPAAEVAALLTSGLRELRQAPTATTSEPYCA